MVLVFINETPSDYDSIKMVQRGWKVDERLLISHLTSVEKHVWNEYERCEALPTNWAWPDCQEQLAALVVLPPLLNLPKQRQNPLNCLKNNKVVLPNPLRRKSLIPSKGQKTGQPKKGKQLKTSPPDWPRMLKTNGLQALLLDEEENCIDHDRLDLTLATKINLKLVEWSRFHHLYHQAESLQIRSKIISWSGKRHETYVLKKEDRNIDGLPDTFDLKMHKELPKKKPEIIKKLLDPLGSSTPSLRRVLSTTNFSTIRQYAVLQCNGSYWWLMDLHVVNNKKVDEPQAKRTCFVSVKTIMKKFLTALRVLQIALLLLVPVQSIFTISHY